MNPIRLPDPVYGEIRLDAPLLLDLYHTDAVQRLAHIYQGGISAFIKPERDTTRLDHSLGVMALLRCLGASVEEQAAGLIHDVPHTAFSHVVDFVFPNHNHTYHEDHREAFIRTTEIPAVTTRHHLAWQQLATAENYTLLEQPLPALCADRLDYFLRDGLTLGFLPAAEVQDFLLHLRVHAGRIVVDTVDAALWLGDQFMRLDDAVWCSVQEVGWYAIMARALRAALEAQLITEGDFWSTDEPLMARLRAADVPAVQHWLALLRRDTTVARVGADPDLVALPKVRAVDPPVLSAGTVTPLSALDADFARRRAAYVASKQGTWQLKITNRGA